WAQLQGQAPPAFLSTHPLTRNRIADARNRAANLSKPSGPTPLGEGTFRRVRARLRVVTADSPQDAYDHFMGKVKNHPENRSARYGLALAARSTGRDGKAIRLLHQLIEQAPEEVAYRSTLAEVLVEAGKPRQAIEAIRTALERRPDAPDLREKLGEAQLAAGDLKAARGTLLELTRDFPQRASAHRALAKAYTRLDQPIRAHREEAEARRLLGQRAEALEQLQVAERLARKQDSDQLSQIQARIKELQ
ncbi:MAG TPA: tetratricopeptide repeat protein, partial [Gammaproteobacteria bacterium]|nr:tetratricopeptide repeat protein [Gammaproteobacteria bacterium]